MPISAKPKIEMALSREYRIRELYLKHLEESFPKDRIAVFVSSLQDCESKLLARFSRIESLGNVNMSQAVLDAYAYSVFEFYSSKRYRMGTLKELERFKRNFAGLTGDYDSNLSVVTDALQHCKVAEILPEDELQRLVLSITLFGDFLFSFQKAGLNNFAEELRDFVLGKVNRKLDEPTYQARIRLYGRLLQTRAKNPDSSLEVTRLALQCLPVGDQRSSNLFLYLVVRVSQLWPEAQIRMLQVPLDSDLSRVIARIGLTQRQLSNFEYGGISYAVIQSLARHLVPENPSSFFGLKYVGKVWCRSRSPDCIECPMNPVCSYAQAVLMQ